MTEMTEMTDERALDFIRTYFAPYAARGEKDLVVEHIAARLRAAPQPPAEAHCATCDCVPGMTPAIRFDTTPAEREGEVRDHLIRMGWTPPAEAQVWCPSCDGAGWTPDAMDGSARAVCPDCAGSGRVSVRREVRA